MDENKEGERHPVREIIPTNPIERGLFDAAVAVADLKNAVSGVLVDMVGVHAHAAMVEHGITQDMVTAAMHWRGASPAAKI